MLRPYLLLSFLLAGAGPAASTGATKAAPLDAVGSILDAFQSHAIVALDEGKHNNEQGYRFRLALIHDPRFSGLVNDIVVEAGNAMYQEIMDRFVAGDDVPHEILRQAWQNTTNPDALWDSPIYEDFYRAVRDLNKNLPHERRIRIVLAETAIDWAKIRNREDWQAYLLKQNTDPADVVRREVLAKNRRGLLIYGGNHLIRRGGRSIVTLLESEHPGSVFNIFTSVDADLTTVQSDLSSWPNPSLFLTRGTIFGEKNVMSFPPAVGGADVRMEDQFDAILYVGPPSSITYSRARKTLCKDESYVQMRLERFRIIGQPQTREAFCAKLAED